MLLRVPSKVHQIVVKVVESATIRDSSPVAPCLGTHTTRWRSSWYFVRDEQREQTCLGGRERRGVTLLTRFGKSNHAGCAPAWPGGHRSRCTGRYSRCTRGPRVHTIFTGAHRCTFQLLLPVSFVRVFPHLFQPCTERDTGVAKRPRWPDCFLSLGWESVVSFFL